MIHLRLVQEKKQLETPILCNSICICQFSFCFTIYLYLMIYYSIRRTFYTRLGESSHQVMPSRSLEQRHHDGSAECWICWLKSWFLNLWVVQTVDSIYPFHVLLFWPLKNLETVKFMSSFLYSSPQKNNIESISLHSW